MIMRFMRRALCGAIDCSIGTSSSRFSPSGVISKIQLKISAGRNPIASKITTVRGNQSGAPNIGNTVLATWVSSHAPTKYNPAARMTFRRLNSLKKFSIFISLLRLYLRIEQPEQSFRRAPQNADRRGAGREKDEL